jgi:hypothetical protein
MSFFLVTPGATVRPGEKPDVPAVTLNVRHVAGHRVDDHRRLIDNRSSVAESRALVAAKVRMPKQNLIQ